MAFDTEKYDAKAFVEGTWEEFDGGQFKIARFGNHVHQDAKKRIEREFERIYGKDLTAAQEEEMNAKIMAEGLLVDWSDIGVEKPVPYTKSNAASLLVKHPPLAMFVQTQSYKIGRFEREKAEQEAAKPGASSDGGTSGAKKRSTKRTASTSE